MPPPITLDTVGVRALHTDYGARPLAQFAGLAVQVGQPPIRADRGGMWAGFVGGITSLFSRLSEIGQPERTSVRLYNEKHQQFSAEVDLLARHIVEFNEAATPLERINALHRLNLQFGQVKHTFAALQRLMPGLSFQTAVGSRLEQIREGLTPLQRAALSESLDYFGSPAFQREFDFALQTIWSQGRRAEAPAVVEPGALRGWVDSHVAVIGLIAGGLASGHFELPLMQEFNYPPPPPPEAPPPRMSYRDPVFRPGTLAPTLSDDNRKGEMIYLDKGQYNSVFLAQFESDGEPWAGVWKREQPITGEGASYAGIGIDPANPKTAARNRAACLLDQAVGFGVIPRTEIARLTVGDEEQTGIVMEYAKGKAMVVEKAMIKEPLGREAPFARQLERLLQELPESERAAYTKDYGDYFGVPLVYENHRVFQLRKEEGMVFLSVDYARDGKFHQEMAKLTLLDAIMGQGDRHIGNYHVEHDSEGRTTRIVGLDNDLAWGGEPSDPRALLKGSFTLPTVVDAVLRDRILALTPDHLQEMLGGLDLGDESIAAAQSRLEIVQNHLRGLPPENIIQPDGWDAHAARFAQPPGVRYNPDLPPDGGYYLKMAIQHCQFDPDSTFPRSRVFLPEAF